MTEKTFINNQLGMKFNSYIDSKLKIWFKAKQVAQILGYKKPDDAIKRHISDSHKIKIVQPRETRGCTFTYLIDEAGFYELVFKSKLETAKIFREWVFTKVLPSIRKYGYYKMIDSRIKQRVIFEEKKYYKHPVFRDYAASKNGNILSLKTKKIIKMNEEKQGYLKFTIYNKIIEKPLNYKQHRFVFEVFKGLIPKCFEIDHINNIKTDNRIKNLQLLTQKKNIQKSLSKPIISIDIETGKEKKCISIKTASIELDINFSHISKICRKKCKTAKSKKDGKNIHLNI